MPLYTSTLYRRIAQFTITVILLITATMGMAQTKGLLQLGAPPYVSEAINVGLHARLCIDTLHQFSFEDIDKIPFQDCQDEIPNYGFSTATFWMAIEVQNTQPQQNDWLLDCNYPLWDSLSIYYQDSAGRWQTQLAGDQVPFQSRLMSYRYFVFPLGLSSGQAQTIYIKAKTQNAAQLPIRFIRKDAFLKESNLSELMYGLYYGIIIVMAIYNFFLFLSLGSKAYLYYAASMISVVMLFMSLNGHSQQYLWGSSSVWTNYSVPFFIGSTLSLWALFANQVIDTKKYAPVWSKIIQACTFIGAGVSVGVFILPYKLILITASVLLSCESIILLTTGAVVYAKGNKVARFFLLAWVSYIIGAILLMLRNLGVLPANFLTSHAVEIGNVIEVLLLSLALADKYKILRHEKEAAQEALLKESKAKTELVEGYAANLEQKVADRTKSLRETVEELHQINEELNVALETMEKQKRAIENQKEELSKKNEDIEASINYAQRIQQAVLPHQKSLDMAFGADNYFILYQPRDIVSGDFYWLAQKDELTIIAVADCTGHGVPGAFMSMIGDSLLNLIVRDRHTYEPDKILLQMDEGIRMALQQQNTDRQDGMDISICTIDRKVDILHFAGAKNPMILMRNGQMQKIQADRNSIGGRLKNNAAPQFHKQSIALNDIDSFYLFTDGYKDQFGGPEDRRFMSKPFYQMLADNSQLPMKEQYQILANSLHQWMEGYRQTDDITVMGLRL